MSVRKSDHGNGAEVLLKALRQLKSDRGAMAELRCALNPATRYRAWPLLGQLHGIGDRSVETVAGLFAFHPDETNSGNLGRTCRLLARSKQSFDGRFRRLIACDRSEICDHLRPVVLAARGEGIPINYEALYADLHFWGERVRARWAQEYWRGPSSEEPEMASKQEALS